MQPIEHATVLVTGGSKGIGFVIAKAFAKHGHDLVLVARHQEELDQAKRKISECYAVDIETIACDLTAPKAAERLYRQLLDKGISIDILVNNAGVGVTGDFAETSLEQTMGMLQLNIMALTELTHLFLQPMLARGYGRILQVGSVVSYFSGAPNWAAYVASKHYVKAWSTGLRRELKGSGVALTLLSPGTVQTDFVRSADAMAVRAYQTPRHISLALIAKQAYQACQKGKANVVPGLFNQVLAFLGELPPRAIAFEVFTFLSQKVDG